jgi:hypothetical protein
MSQPVSFGPFEKFNHYDEFGTDPHAFLHLLSGDVVQILATIISTMIESTPISLCFFIAPWYLGVTYKARGRHGAKRALSQPCWVICR